MPRGASAHLLRLCRPVRRRLYRSRRRLPPRHSDTFLATPVPDYFREGREEGPGGGWGFSGHLRAGQVSDADVASKCVRPRRPEVAPPVDILRSLFQMERGRLAGRPNGRRRRHGRPGHGSGRVPHVAGGCRCHGGGGDVHRPTLTAVAGGDRPVAMTCRAKAAAVQTSPAAETCVGPEARGRDPTE